MPDRVEIKIVLVPHGYQLDIYNHVFATDDGSGVEHSRICQDFASSHDTSVVCEMITLQTQAMMANLETELKSDPIFFFYREIKEQMGHPISLNSLSTLARVWKRTGRFPDWMKDKRLNERIKKALKIGRK